MHRRLLGPIAGLLVAAIPVPLAAQVAQSQGVAVTTTGATPGTVNVTGFDGTVPIFLQTTGGWSIDASGDGASVTLTGTQVSTTGLPTTSPAPNALVDFNAIGTSAIDTTSTVTSGAGSVTVTTGTSAASTVTLSGQSGSASGPAGLSAVSEGADGFHDSSATITDGVYTTELNAGGTYSTTTFSGTSGGAVGLTLGAGTTISVSGSGTGAQADLLTPTLVGVAAASLGGDGTIGFYTTGVDQSPTPYPGNGGAAGTVAVATAAGTSITVTQAGAGSNAVGLSAVSRGGNAAAGNINTTEDHYVSGSAGAAGAVAVTHAGRIEVDAPAGAGIYALSIGGNGNVSGGVPEPTAEGNTPNPAPANGQAVTVTLQAGSSVVLDQGGIGVFALSRAGDWTPTGAFVSPLGGAVSVTLDQGASVTVTGSGGATPAPFAFGVLAVSAGQSLVSDPLIGEGSGQGSGSAGSVTLSNAGQINTSGELSAGMAAIAIGGAPIVATAQSGTNNVGNSGATQPVFGGTVQVTNTGTISTAGDSAYGILAISAGGGGVVRNEAAATVSGSAWTAGTSLGAATDSNALPTSAGAVTVTHSGSIATGNGTGGGDAAFGILAQSIGGSGGTVGGSQALQYLGDSSGGGGSGGPVTVTLQGSATVETRDKNAHGVLVQSIGGGGGNGANSSAAFVAVGGGGGSGGDGNVATFTATPSGGGRIALSTLGNYASGVVVQSVGGGGGNGGIADSSGVFVAKSTGGTGGGGGAGGTAGAYNNAGSSISTLGNQGPAMLVHSVGGGGGTGGAATSYSAGVFFTVAGAMGGAGGGGGAGGLVTGINHGSLSTGVAASALANVAFVANTGTLFATLPDGTDIAVYFTSGGISGGVPFGTLQSITRSDGSVVSNVRLSGNTLSGTTQNSSTPYSVTLSGAAISQAVATDSSASLVSGLIVGTEFVVPTNSPNPNGADSDGMVVQSIGGGGGKGGAAAAKSLVLPLPGVRRLGIAIPTVGISYAVGGSGGPGGDGGGVTAGNGAAIATQGDSARGVLAQSIGGGGGSGGDGTASSMAIQSAGFDVQVSVGLGGSGGVAGSGATVTAFNGASDGSEAGTIATYGQYSAGMMAQSIGGGGGVGGIGTASLSTPTLHTEAGAANKFAISVGGSGGAGGQGGSVFVSNYPGSSIRTFGSTAPGILAQSIGSGGGAGGGGSATGSGGQMDIDVSVGGSGAGGGSGSVVQVENAGLIQTAAGSSHGIIAQSIGGGGGSAGTADASAGAAKWYDTINSSVAALLSMSNSYNADVSVGGTGGTGGDGGSASVTNSAGSIAGPTWTPGIATAGSRSYGILAQSIGGGGGTGAASTASSRSAPRVILGSSGTYTANVIVGGGAGSAGNGGTATITNTGVVVTRGYGAAGVVAHAIGGSGGMGADGSVDSDLTVTLGDQLSYSNPGTGYTGGVASVINATGAGIMTTGRDAPAIVAQSIGGGGGIASAGDDSFTTIGGGQAGTATHTITVGGIDYEDAVQYGLPVNPGDLARVTHSGAIVTMGDWSPGIVAQSIGGGGGMASAYTTTSVATNLTLGVGVPPPDSNYAYGNYAYGNGGGVQVVLPNRGAAATIATGTATTAGGTTQRTGYAAYGILAQSIGGGGGLAVENTAAGTLATGSVSVGGDNVGSGGTVLVGGNATVTTLGDTAHAVLLQSIGMGGGVGGQGSSLTADSPAATNAVSLSLNPLTEYMQGNGGAIGLDSILTIRTGGADAYGILAQSIGGGGGLAFAQNASLTQTSIGSIYDSPTYQLPSDGGAVGLKLTSGSSITTGGDRAHAIVAQSIGGGGGIAGYASNSSLQLWSVLGEVSSNQLGSGGKVEIDIDADVTTTGAGAYGILAQSIGGGGGLIARNGTLYAGSAGNSGQGGGEIIVTQAGSVQTTGADSVAIFAQSTEGGTPNPITVSVNGAVAGGSNDGVGIWVDGGLNNTVVVGASGSVAAASNTAIYYTGGGELAVDNYGSVTGNVLIDGSTFTNYGTYNVGDASSIEGYFTQDTAGTLTFNFGSNPAPRLSVQYDTNLYGTVRPIVSGWLLPVTNAVIAPGPGAAVYNYYAATPSTPIFGWNYSQPEPFGILYMTPFANFTSAAGGLDANEQSAAAYLQGQWNASNANLSGFFAALYSGIDTPAAYRTMLDDMSPAASQTFATQLSDVSGAILGAAMSCPAFEGTSTLIGEGTCVWAKGGGSVINRYDTGGSVSSWTTGAGGQKEIGNGWAVGGMLGTDASRASGGSASGTGNSYYGSLALKRVEGPWTVAMGVAGAVGTYSVDRHVETDGLTVSSESTSYLIGARARAAYDVAFERFYVRPMIDLDVYHLYTPSYDEDGASAFALTVDASHYTGVVVSPAVEVGFRRDVDAQTILRGFFSIGASATPTPDRVIDASLALAGSPARFSTDIETPAILGTASAGLQLYQDKGWDVRGETQLRVGDGFLGVGGQLRLSYRF
ncbi:hypothetical protein [Amorphus suaedae]